MRSYKTFVLLFAYVCIVLSCCKDNKVGINSHSLVGIWEMRVAGGGWVPYVTFPTGNGHIIKFTSSAFEYDSVGKVISSGTYRIVKDHPTAVYGTTDRIIYDNNTNDSRSYISLSGDSLRFMIDAYDAGSTTYVRISKDPGSILSSK